MIRINQCKLRIDQDISELSILIKNKLRIKDIPFTYTIFKESVDARKGEIHFIYTVDVTIENETIYLKRKDPDIVLTPQFHYEMPNLKGLNQSGRVVIVGFGPAGLFAALLLAQVGLRPIVYERGEGVDERVLSVQKFWEERILNENSNVQFGEGGAGTFSDGKLTARTKDLRSGKVLEEFVRFGAPKEILYEAHPHIGTDLLRGIIKQMRSEIIALGGEVHFNTCISEFQVEERKLKGIQVQGEFVDCDDLILAIGHSARDTFVALEKSHIAMEAKPFAVGVRIEHPQSFINQAQYKTMVNHPRLRSAEYRLTHTCKSGRGVYSFCMCPGGSVVASASSAGMLVTNGMSTHARDLENANSALLVQVSPKDFGDQLFAGMNFQIQLEKKAFELGGSTYQAPIQLVKDFMNNVASSALGSVKPTYSCGYTLSNLHDLFPPFISEALMEGMEGFHQKIKGFKMDDAIMTGVETRSSSPIRIIRDANTLESINCEGLFPCGEGGGYAGGIVSAAIDGLRCAEKIIEKYQRSNQQ